MKKFIFILALIGSLLEYPLPIQAAPIPSEVKNTVAFIYVPGLNRQIVPNGTGFFIGVEDLNKKDYFTVYLVTAKHVLQTSGKKWLPFFVLRLNKKDGSSELVPVPIIPEGEKKNVFIHEDPSVDLAVVPALPDQKVYNFKFLPASMLTGKVDFDKLGIGEGSDVFFTGLFLPYPGYERNYPIVRFGRVALLTEEKIDWNGELLDLYLVESGSFGGSSGSPVFFYFGSDRRPGVLALGPPVIKIAGIMKGTFQDVQPLKTIETAKILAAPSSMGISAVIPAYKLHDIIFGKELNK